MEISPIAYYHCPLPQKFGLPRQAGLAEELEGRVVLEPAFRRPEALRGLDGFDYIWLIWEFSLNGAPSDGHPRPDRGSLTVRPPRLGGNERVGVFASRSPFRPNPLGLSSVRIKSIDFEKGEITVLGADLADGTPIYDIKPYVAYCDSHPAARSGFVDGKEWKRLEVQFASAKLEQLLSDSLGSDYNALQEVLSEDPRPQYHDNPEKEYGLSFGGLNIRFKVRESVLTVEEVSQEAQGLF